MSYHFKTKLLKDEQAAIMWYFFIHVPVEYAKELIKEDRRVVCTFNDSLKSHSALTSDGNGNYCITINKENRKKLGIEAGDTIDVHIENDSSEYGIAVPEVFYALIEQDPEGSTVFHQLTPGKQRSLLHIMGKPKSENKQMEKAFIIFDYLKSVHGKLDFKELNEAFKNSRFKL